MTISIKTCLGAALLLAGQLACAHAHLEKAQPAAGSKSAEVREVRLAFSEALEARLSTIQIEDREDRKVVEPEAQLDPADAKILVLHLFEKLPPGSYKLRWAVVAADGHRMKGDYSFLVSP
jgi:methionine-rich copper-binding protein CopC